MRTGTLLNLKERLDTIDSRALAAVTAAEAAVTASTAAVAATSQDQAKIALKFDRRPRPQPYDIRLNHTLLSSGTVNTFGTRLKIIEIGDYDFGDTPNQIQIEAVVIELLDVAQYIMLFEKSSDGVVFSSIGAVRFNSAASQTRSFIVPFPTRDVDNDVYAVYASLKSHAVSKNVNFAVVVARHQSVTAHVEPSTGAFPTG